MIISQHFCFDGHSRNLNFDEMFLLALELEMRDVCTAGHWIWAANLLNIGSFLYCTFFSIYSRILTRRHQGEVLCRWIIGCWRERWREGRRKNSADSSVRLPAEKFTLCFGKVINFCLFCWKTASHFLSCRFIGTFGHTLSSSAQSKYNSYFFWLYSS